MSGLFPRGEDCGNHEAFLHRGGVYGCYHCRMLKYEGELGCTDWTEAHILLDRIDMLRSGAFG